MEEPNIMNLKEDRLQEDRIDQRNERKMIIPSTETRLSVSHKDTLCPT